MKSNFPNIDMRTNRVTETLKDNFCKSKGCEKCDYVIDKHDLNSKRFHTLKEIYSVSLEPGDYYCNSSPATLKNKKKRKTCHAILWVVNHRCKERRI